MAYYDNANKFKPSVDTLKKWLKTRKAKLGIKPGLFETVDSSTDQLWSIIALLIEMTALGLTLYGAWTKYLITGKVAIMILAGILVFLFIVFDYIGILLHIHDEPDKVITRNTIKITSDSTRLKILYGNLEAISWRRFTSYILLFLSALLKIIALLQFVGSSALVIIILTLFYLVVIYIHSQHTGYFLSYLSFNRALKLEYKEWLSSNTNGLTNQFQITQPDQIVFTTNAPLFPIENKLFQNGRQKIYFTQKTSNSDSSVSFEYTLTTEGCLWDEDITILISFFNPHLTMPIVENCIRLQFTQLGIIT